MIIKFIRIFVFLSIISVYAPAAENPGRDVNEQSQNFIDKDNLRFDEIIFIKRKPYSSDHYYTDINNGTSPDRFLPENGIYIYNLRTGEERPVVTAAKMPGGRGFIGKISLSFDASKVIFDFRENPQSGFRIWEVNTDGTGLRQITFPAQDEEQKVARWGRKWHTDDIHPCYLPDGRIIFSSTRCEHTILCGGSAHLVAPLLHTMNAEGGDITQLTKSPVSEFCPVVLDDGRVMYHRWEYIDKGARVCKTIWSMNPDGTRQQEIYGLDDDTTTVYMYPQAIPGDRDHIVCVGTCHYPQGGCLGAVMLIDIRSGINRRGPDPDEPGYVQWDTTSSAVINLTPHVFIERRTEPGWYFLMENGRYKHDKNGQSGHLYTHPMPVSKTEFLVSYKENKADHYKNTPDAYSIYMINTSGQHRLIHKDRELSLWHPTPVITRDVPPEIYSYRDPEYAKQKQALCIVKNIYENMDNVRQGEIKWVRINEAVPRYWDTGRRWPNSASSSSWKAALWPRVQWGIVPVEKDGSAHFVVPADRSIFFQALDENFREIQRERTYVNYRPGEIRSCVGCHGRTSHTSNHSVAQTTIAMKRPPSIPQPQPCDLIENGGDGKAQQVIHFPADIQPIFNNKCIKCHGGDDPEAGLRLTDEITTFYNTAYEEICRKQLAGPVLSEFTTFARGDQGNYSGSLLSPKSLGTYKSKMFQVLTDPEHPVNAREDHSKKLTKNEIMVLTRWIDSNYQFYGAYYGRQHAAWVKADPANPEYNPQRDFRRKAEFEEAISDRAPEWHQ